MRPCIDCGQPSPQSRCPDHRRRKDNRRRTGPGEAAYDPVWRRLSAAARRASPFCESCGSVESLTVDHVVPKSVCPELVHSLENCRVLCRTCNSRRGVKFAAEEVQAVIDRLTTAYNRQPTRGGRERINAARRAITRGEAPSPDPCTPPGEAKFESLSPAGQSAVAGSGASKP